MRVLAPDCLRQGCGYERNVEGNRTIPSSVRSLLGDCSSVTSEPTELRERRREYPLLSATIADEIDPIRPKIPGFRDDRRASRTGPLAMAFYIIDIDEGARCSQC